MHAMFEASFESGLVRGQCPDCKLVVHLCSTIQFGQVWQTSLLSNTTSEYYCSMLLV